MLSRIAEFLFPRVPITDQELMIMTRQERLDALREAYGILRDSTDSDPRAAAVYELADMLMAEGSTNASLLDNG